MNNILAWNVRGLNKAKKQEEVARFISNHNISLFGLLETKVKRNNLGRLYQNICPGWCFTHNLDWHKGGRIIIAWKGEDIKVDIKRYHSQYIHLEVFPSFDKKFMCTFVYSATNKHIRQDLLNHLEDMNQGTNMPWIVLGDFNCIANLNEKIGSPPRLHETMPLRHCMESCGLYDLKSNDRFFTWNNKQARSSRVMSKIDRIMENNLWEDNFPNVKVSYHPEGDFDHTPMLVCFLHPINTKKTVQIL